MVRRIPDTNNGDGPACVVHCWHWNDASPSDNHLHEGRETDSAKRRSWEAVVDHDRTRSRCSNCRWNDGETVLFPRNRSHRTVPAIRCNAEAVVDRDIRGEAVAGNGDGDAEDGVDEEAGLGNEV